MGRKNKEDGKPCVTSVTIIMFEIIIHQTSPSFSLFFFVKDQNIPMRFNKNQVANVTSQCDLTT